MSGTKVHTFHVVPRATISGLAYSSTRHLSVASVVVLESQLSGICIRGRQLRTKLYQYLNSS